MMIINPYQTLSSFVTPTDLKVWLRADEGVTYNISNQVATWADQSGNALDAFQNTTSYKPTYVASNANFNNKPTINFVASSDDYMNLPISALLNFSSGFTIYVVAKVAFANTFNMLIQHTNGTTWTQGWGILYYNSTSSYRFFVNNWNNTANYVDLAQTNTASDQIYKFKWDGTTITAAILGSVPVSGTKAFSGPYTNPSATYNVEIARGGSTIYDMTAEMPEILMYSSGNIGAINEAGIENYLKNKYGIA